MGVNMVYFLISITQPYHLTIYILVNTLANRVDPDEMMHKVAFHQCLHCVLRLNNINPLCHLLTLDHDIIFFF